MNFHYLLFLHARSAKSLSAVLSIVVFICFQIAIDTTAYDDVEDDTVFFTKLFNEQSVSCLPASVSPRIKKEKAVFFIKKTHVKSNKF